MLSPTGFITETAKSQLPEVQLLPHSASAEWALLGALLIDPEQMLEVGYLQPEHFFIVHNGKLYKVLSELFSQHGNYDIVMVVDALESAGILDELGGPGSVSALMNETPTSYGAPHYADIIYRDAISRQTIDKATRIVAKAYERELGRTGEQLVNEALQEFADIDATRNVSSGPKSMSSAVNSWFSEMQAVQENGGPIGVRSGIKSLDRILGGFEKGKTYFLGGRPGMGKSSLALQIAHNAAKSGSQVMIFALEMGANDTVGRLISQEVVIPYSNFKKNNFDDWGKLVTAASEVEKLPILIDDTPALTISAIRNLAGREKAKNGLDLLIIDHIGIIKPETRSEDRTTQIVQISDGVMAMAKQLNLPILALSQFSRGPEARQNKRPLLSDWKDSGKIEENADGAIALYRESYYDPDTEFQNLIEVIVQKNRGGETGTATVFGSLPTARFVDLETRSVSL